VAGLLRKFARGFSGSMAESMGLQEKEAILLEREKRLHAHQSRENRLDREGRAEEGLLRREAEREISDRNFYAQANSREADRITLENAQAKTAAIKAAIEDIKADPDLNDQERAFFTAEAWGGKLMTKKDRELQRRSSTRPTAGHEWDYKKEQWVESKLSLSDRHKNARQIMDDLKEQNEALFVNPEDRPTVEERRNVAYGMAGIPIPRLPGQKETAKEALARIQGLPPEEQNAAMAKLPQSHQDAILKQIMRAN